MGSAWGLLAGLLAQVAPAAPGAAPGEAEVGTAEGLSLGALVRAAAGALSGEGEIRGQAAVTTVEAELAPSWSQGPLRLEAGLAAGSRRTVGASLSETRGKGELGLRFRPGGRLRFQGGVSVAGVWRPDWPDLYQPMPGGGVASTDRYSHWDRQANGGVAGTPFRHHHVRLGYSYTLAVYRKDPVFDSVARPDHLTPGDLQEHTVDGSWRLFAGRWRLGAGAEASWRKYFFRFARDAGTGRTHAGPGGPAPNPLQHFRISRPFVSVERAVPRTGGWHYELRYGFEAQTDRFEGYYSAIAHRPRLELGWRSSEVLEVDGFAEAALRRFGANGYTAGPGHPPLRYGTGRLDRRGRLGLDVRVPAWGGWQLVGTARLSARRTNFPLYQPGVFPSGQDYDVDWDYENWIVMLGVERRFAPGGT